MIGRVGLANARFELAEKTDAKLVWNYLPVDIAQRAAEKLTRALQTCKTFPDFPISKHPLTITLQRTVEPFPSFDRNW
jgi:hypothetical protein